MIKRVRDTEIMGFTLLEVLVAMAILALGLSSIFASQVGAVKTAHRARHYTVASFLARCKMGEIEELIVEEGLPAIEKKGRDACCEHAEVDGFRCEWAIERIVLPDDAMGGDEEGEDPIAALASAAGGGAAGGDAAASGAGVVDSMLTGGGGDGLADLAMSFAFPIMKPAIEEGVRRVTVEVKWGEGDSEHGFDVVQFLVAEPPPVVPTDDGS